MAAASMEVAVPLTSLTSPGGKSSNSPSRLPGEGDSRSPNKSEATTPDGQPLFGVFKLSMNLSKSIMATGVVLMPSAARLVSGHRAALLPSLVMLVCMGCLSGYTWTLVAKVCRDTGEQSYQGAWLKTALPGKAWVKWVCVVPFLGQAHMTCTNYTIIMAKSLGRLWAQWAEEDASMSEVERAASLGQKEFIVIIAIYTLIAGPLCCLTNLASLAKFSMIGQVANAWIVFMVLYNWQNSEYEESGEFLDTFTPTGMGLASALCSMATCFNAHYDPALYYEQLEPGPDGTKDRRFLAIACFGFGGGIAVFALIMTGGFMTFGLNTDSSILNSYREGDMMAILARVAISVSLAMSYLLVFFSLRRQVCNALGEWAADLLDSARPRILVTLVLLFELAVIAITLKEDLGTICQIGGAIFSNSLLYLLPAIMALRALDLGYDKPQGFSSLWDFVAPAMQFIIIPFGFFLMVLSLLKVAFDN